MERPSRPLRSHCPVNFGLEAIGDRWALLIVRDIVFRGKRTFGEFLNAEEGWATNILSTRLQHLIDQGILERRENGEDRRRAVYTLTEKGLDLLPLVFEMVLWSSRHDPDSQAKLITRLVERIQRDNRTLSAEAREQVRQGLGVVAIYHNPPTGEPRSGA